MKKEFSMIIKKMKYIALFCLLVSTQVYSQIILLLAHPRSLSTLFERIVLERRDFTILNEPFTYLYYLKIFPDHKEELASFPEYFPKNYADLKAYLFELSKEKDIFIKDMGFAAVEFIKNDPEFFKHVNIMIMVRNPIKVLPSLYKIMPDASPEFMGYEAIDTIVNILPVTFFLDADDLENNPQLHYAEFCKAFNIEFSADALMFTLPPLPDWKGPWFEHINNSTTIEKSTKEYPVDTQGNPVFAEMHKKDRARWIELYHTQKMYYDRIKSKLQSI